MLELFRFKTQLPELSFIIERLSLFIDNLQHIIIVLIVILLLLSLYSAKISAAK
ncbi:MAG: hypothetical protein ACI9F1_000776 [Colwellia sp.]